MKGPLLKLASQIFSKSIDKIKNIYSKIHRRLNESSNNAVKKLFCRLFTSSRGRPGNCAGQKITILFLKEFLQKLCIYEKAQICAAILDTICFILTFKPMFEQNYISHVYIKSRNIGLYTSAMGFQFKHSFKFPITFFKLIFENY